MNILITGGSGFIGSALVDFYVNNKNRNVTIISRQSFKTKGIKLLSFTRELNLEKKIGVIINLAVATMNKRWSDSYKEELINSKLKVTKDIVYLIKKLKTKPSLLISASAIVYYGLRNNNYIDESSSYIEDFTHKLCSV